MNNFNIEHLFYLRSILEKKVIKDPNNFFYRYQLVFIILQLKFTIADIGNVYELISPMIHINNKSFNRLKEILLMILENDSMIDNQLNRINWSIYNKCPIRCEGCYNDFRKDQLLIKDIKSILHKIKKFGINNIIISGGDPLLWLDLNNFMHYSN
jgi:hypothetical protein